MGKRGTTIRSIGAPFFALFALAATLLVLASFPAPAIAESAAPDVLAYDPSSKDSAKAAEKRVKRSTSVDEAISKRREGYEKRILKNGAGSASESAVVRRHLSQRANRAARIAYEKAPRGGERRLLRRGGHDINYAYHGSFSIS